MSQEVVLMQEVNFEIAMNNIAFVHFEELLLQLKGVAKVGELVYFEAGMDIMDLLYEKEEILMLYTNPGTLLHISSQYLNRCWNFPFFLGVRFLVSLRSFLS
ncbi:hypothetical protein EV2_025677 [Malus domestica]